MQQSIKAVPLCCVCCRCQVSDSITQFVAAAEAEERDMPPGAVTVASVTDVSKEAFCAAVMNAPAVRLEHE